jgi:thioredoxin
MRRSISFLAAFLLVWAPLAAAGASRPIFDANADAGQQIAAALAKASTTGKNVLLIFGANWCPDCHALDAQMHKPDLAELIRNNYEVVKIDVGFMNKNLAVGKRYGVPIRRGIPAIAVLDPQGKVLYAQDQGQFSDARNLPYQDFKAFFEKWKLKP